MEIAEYFDSVVALVFLDFFFFGPRGLESGQHGIPLGKNCFL